MSEHKFMDIVGDIRNEMSKLWHDNMNIWFNVENCSFLSQSHYDAFCAAKDWLQDTSEVIFSHYKTDFSKNTYQAYLEFWGIMQAIVIQQDAIEKLYYAFNRDFPKRKDDSTWLKLRRIRNSSVGHPVDNKNKNKPLVVIDRSPKSYNGIKISIYRPGGYNSEFEILKLGKLLEEYDKEASDDMRELLNLLNDQLKYFTLR